MTEPLRDANGNPIWPAIPPEAICCGNCFWAHGPVPNEPEQVYACWAEPPKIFMTTRANPIKGMPPHQGTISMHPIVKVFELCSHFMNRPEAPSAVEIQSDPAIPLPPDDGVPG